MNLTEALSIIENNQHLLGLNYRGAQIEDLLILPIDNTLSDELINLYIRTLDNNLIYNNILPNEPVNIVAICDKNLIRTRGMIFKVNIKSLPEEFNVQI